MDKKTYGLSAMLGIGVTLTASALFASTLAQSIVGVLLGVPILITGYILAGK